MKKEKDTGRKNYVGTYGIKEIEENTNYLLTARNLGNLQ